MKRRSTKPSPVLNLAAALIGEASDTLVTADTRFRHSFEVEVDLVEPNPDQPRKHLDESELRALALTMKAAGQLQPILLRRKPGDPRRWTIVAGERRWRAAQLNEWPTILAIELDSDPEIAALLENLQRVDLTPHEEAQALHRLIASKNWTQERAADALGRSKAEVSATLRILSLPEEIIRTLTSEHSVTRNVLVELARVEDLQVRDRLVGLAKSGDLTIRAIREGKAPEGAARKQTESRSKSFNYQSVGKLEVRLRNLRAAGLVPAASERAHLEALRKTIDDLLRM